MPRIRRSRAPKRIEASSIVLKDTEGNARIILDAGGSNGYATIVMTTQDGRVGFEIGSQPGGDIVMSFGNAGCTGAVTLSSRGLVIHDAERRLSVVIGTDSLRPAGTPGAPSAAHIAVYREGNLAWSSPRNARQRSKARESLRVSKVKKIK